VKSAKYRDQPNTTDNCVNLRRWPYRAIGRSSQETSESLHNTDTTGLGFGHDTAPILKQGGIASFHRQWKQQHAVIYLQLCYTDSLARSSLVPWYIPDPPPCLKAASRDRQFMAVSCPSSQHQDQRQLSGIACVSRRPIAGTQIFFKRKTVSIIGGKGL
jgi:hypothetical protein